MAGDSKTTKNTVSKGTKAKSTTKKSATQKSSSSKSKKEEKKFGDSIYDEISIIMLLLLSILVLLSLFTSVMGLFGEAVNTFLKGLFGAGSYTMPIVLIVFCSWMIISKERRLVFCKVLGIILFVVSISTFFQLITEGDVLIGQKFGDVVSNFYKNASSLNGGVIGGVIAWGLKSALGWGSYIVAIVAIVISIMLGTGKSLFIMVGNALGFVNDRKMVKEAKIKAQAENIKEREVKRQEKAEVEEQRRLEKMEKRANKRGILNIMLGGNEGHSSKGLALEDEDYLEQFDKDNIEEVEDAYKITEREPIDLSDINFDEEGPLIEVIGVTDIIDGNIPIFGINSSDIDNVENPSDELINVNFDSSLVDEPSKIDLDKPVSEILEPAIGMKGHEQSNSDVSTSNISERPKGEPGGANEIPVEVIKIEPEKEEYVFPPIQLLGLKEVAVGGETKTDMLANAKKLEETLKSFGVVAKVTQINKGPTVTRYELSPNQGVKVSKIVNLADDIALNLAATGIRIEAPIPGKAAVGIEVPNKETQSVYLRSVLESEAFQKFPSKLAFALGEDIAGKAIVADIAKMPHLLIAGATGSGKSVCINTLITSILYKADPEEVKLILIDPKVVELSVYNGIPHLLIPVVTDPKKAASALNWGVREMLGRYQSFAEHNVRDLKGYNSMKEEKGELDKMPQIVIVIDELADLMMAAPGEVEDAICRLAQMARAAGIHLIIATQRPSVDVITGVIKANIPSRLAFAVSSGIDSRTILDSVGAEKLLGKGDMLFYPVGMSKPVRIQGAFVTDKEVESIVDFVKGGRNHTYDPKMVEQITTVAKTAETGEESDEFYDQAVDLVVEKEKASVSLLQRQFRIGYNRAARIMEDMENRGIVGPEDGSKPRKVLITQTQLNEMRYPVTDEVD